MKSSYYCSLTDSNGDSVSGRCTVNYIHTATGVSHTGRAGVNSSVCCLHTGYVQVKTGSTGSNGCAVCVPCIVRSIPTGHDSGSCVHRAISVRLDGAGEGEGGASHQL